MISPDMVWLTTEAKEMHLIFTNLFYSFVTVLLLIGVLIEYFKLPLGGLPSFASLVGRVFVACILLTAYPEIANWTADLTDGLSQAIGGLNTIEQVTQKTSKVFETYSFSWINIGDNIVFVLAYMAYFIMYVTIFFFDAAVLYGLTLLYIFSPILIALFVLPSTASATKALFRTLFEISCWKIVWSVLAVLLWSTALRNLEDTSGNGPNFIITLTYIVILVLSLLLTPKIVGGLFNAGLSGVSSGLLAMGTMALTMEAISPQALASLPSKSTQKLRSRFSSNRRKQNPPKKPNRSRTPKK